MYGYLVQPNAVKIYGPDVLARAVVRPLPGPDLIGNLVAPTQLIRARQQELTIAKIERELLRWSSLPLARVRSVDASQSPDAIAREILERM